MRWLRWIAFGAAAALTASGEYELARLAGWPAWIAWLLPIALDVYSYASFATRRRADTLAALALMIATNAVYHLAATGIMPAGWQLVVMVAALPPVICWRVHRLGEAGDPSVAPVMEVPPAEVPAVVVPPVRMAAEVLPSSSASEVLAERRLHAIPAERKRQEVPASLRKRRPVAETRKLAAEIRAEHPSISQRALAEQLGISDRQLRNVLAAV